MRRPKAAVAMLATMMAAGGVLAGTASASSSAHSHASTRASSAHQRDTSERHAAQKLKPFGAYRVPQHGTCTFTSRFSFDHAAPDGAVKAKMSPKYHHDHPLLKYQWGAAFWTYQVLVDGTWRTAQNVEALSKLHWKRWANFKTSSLSRATAMKRFPRATLVRWGVLIEWFAPHKQNHAQSIVDDGINAYEIRVRGLGLGVDRITYGAVPGGTSRTEASCPLSFDHQWLRLDVSKPPVDRGMWMVYDSATKAIVLFGGTNKDNIVQGSTWQWKDDTWSRLSPADAPDARVDSAMAFDDKAGQGVLFGGWVNQTLFGDTWIWDGHDWQKRATPVAPEPREGASMAYDAATGDTVLFGGWNGSSVLGDTWVWDGSTWSQADPSTSPPPRSGAEMAYDPNSGNVVLFGGYDGQPTRRHVDLGRVDLASPHAIEQPTGMLLGSDDV